MACSCLPVREDARAVAHCSLHPRANTGLTTEQTHGVALEHVLAVHSAACARQKMRKDKVRDAFEDPFLKIAHARFAIRDGHYRRLAVCLAHSRSITTKQANTHRRCATARPKP